MRGKNSWHYIPYTRPIQTETAVSPYICRLAPQKEGFAFDWFDRSAPDGAHTLYYRKRDTEDAFTPCPITAAKACVTGLANNTDYEFYLENALGKRSCLRLVRTGDAPADAVVVDYLHPQDMQFDFSGHSPAAPSIVRTASGALLASSTICFDRTDWPATARLTVLYRSCDHGATWDYLCDIYPLFNGTLYVHKDTVYLLGLDMDYGDLIVGKSEDEGLTWSAPVCIGRGEGAHRWGWHSSTTNFVHIGGRIYKPLEFGYVNEKPTAEQMAATPLEATVLGGRNYMLSHYQGVLSIGEDEDWMQPENWVISDFIRVDGVDPLQCIEGNIVSLPDGRIVNLLRTIHMGESLLTEVNAEHPEAALTYLKTVTDFPFSTICKFSIRRDERTGYYIALGSTHGRKHLAMAVSKDFECWEIVHSIADGRGTGNAFSYMEWLFDEEDIILISRSAWNGANNAHDNNCLTFHRIINYRQYLT